MKRSLIAFTSALLCANAAFALDISGVWMPTAIGPTGERNRAWPATPPFRPEALAQLEEYRANYNAVEDDAGRSCLPYGMPVQMLGTAQYPLEVIETDGRITVLFELHNDARRIHLDTKAHPAGLLPTFMGHSIGYWQDDQLHVETVAVRSGGMPRPHGPRMKLTEVYRGIDGGESGPMLELMMTLDDPDFYTEPFTMRQYFRRYDGLQMGEYFCSEDLWRLNYDNIDGEIPWR
ncbi:MAG: hypothetical protein H6978_10630 [Gammaproteobacteria bacterium]|nr:hypothetical protein [Gammaproteobacteria bacterium]